MGDNKIREHSSRINGWAKTAFTVSFNSFSSPFQCPLKCPFHVRHVLSNLKSLFTQK